MKLVIAEKPDQGAKLASPFKNKKQQGFIEISPNDTFPNGALITWAVGHVCELVPPEEYDPSLKKWSLASLPILPEKFKHRVSPSKAKQFQVIKSLLTRSDVDEIVHAGDAGREGEYIVRIAVQLSGVNKPMKRLWISSLTPKAVEQGFLNLKDEQDTRSLYYEAVSRSCADWLVGMNGSRVYSLLFQRKGIREVFSTGRVQSPTLALIVAREKEIQNFKPEPFWELKAKFLMKDTLYEGTWFRGEQSRFPSRDEADNVRSNCENKLATVKEIESERKEFQPPQLFNLSSLQAVANQIYKYSPQNCLNTLQQLYLEGYISYPRSDSAYVTPEEAKQFPDILSKLSRQDMFKDYFPLSIQSIANNKRFVNAAKVSDHYAIIPTEVVPQINRLKPEERNLYELIVKRLIAAHYDKAIIDYSRLITIVGDQETFLTKGKLIVQEGWRKVLYEQDSKEDAEMDVLPPLKQGDTGTVKELIVKEGKTQAPKRYTEGQLITLMKTAGKHLEDTELEKILEKTEGLGTEATRASIISVLKDRNYIEVKKNMVYATSKGVMLIDALGNSILASAEMTAKWEQRLHEVGQGKASPQSFMEQARKLSQKIIDDAIQNSRTWTFTAKNLETKTPSENKDKAIINIGLGRCPKCTEEVLDTGAAYSCSAKPKCDFSFSKKVLGKTITETQIKKFLEKGKTNLIKGFKKGEKTFDAMLIWKKEEGKVGFEFRAK
ncbi:DNA topoisomerase [Paenibacillus chitinolyticus]|uniref:DNA topoisomerase III n=1 Tax=Paenibacillus chitinolyticus TaxID=79263 RepID=UPI0026E5037B|nr:DNA topoisomerase III [Paenibacillus chitinolyticus]GKS09824.1 DNA topoisomerase [Paenibacillus chitinolyticus]